MRPVQRVVRVQPQLWDPLHRSRHPAARPSMSKLMSIRPHSERVGMGFGATVTVRLAIFEPGPAVGTSVVVTPLVLFGWVPTVLEVTTTVTVQLLLAGMVIPLRIKLVWPFARLLPPAPTQVPLALCPPLMAMLVRLSVKLALVITTLFGLFNVKVIVEVPPAVIGLGTKALAMVGWV